MSAKLRHSYIRIKLADGNYSYGGSQKWFEHKNMHGFGCGVIAAHDVTAYLSQAVKEGAEEEPLMEEEYRTLLTDYRKRYVPLIPHVGSVGWFLAEGMNRAFKRRNLKFRARWGVRPEHIFTSMEKMLKQDIPVILSIGPNMPDRKNQYMLALYQRRADGAYTNVSACKAHFVVATAMNEEWIQVSSWGIRYYIKIQEYKDYVHYHSNWLGSNIMVIRKGK